MTLSEKIEVLIKTVRIFKERLDEVVSYNSFLIGIISEEEFEDSLSEEDIIYKKDVDMTEFRDKILFIMSSLRIPITSYDIADILEIDEDVIDSYMHELVEKGDIE